MPIQPTQADLDDYNRRMALQNAPIPQPVYWGPDANAYSYERHVREEQEAQRRRELEVMAGRGGRSGDRGSAEANRQADIERLLAKELGVEDLQAPPASQPPAAKPARQRPQADPVRYFGNGMFSVPPGELPPAKAAGNRAEAAFLPAPFQVLSRDVSRVTPADTEKYRREQLSEFANPTQGPAAAVNAIGRGAGKLARNLVRSLAGLPDVSLESVVSSGIPEAVDRIEVNKSRHPSATGISQDMQMPAVRMKQVPGQISTMEELQAVIADPDRTVDFSQEGPLSKQLEDLAGVSPEERALDTRSDILESMIRGGSKAINARRPYLPDADEEKRKTAGRLRNKRTGQVDELSNLGGGRGAMMIALANRDRQDLSTPEGRRAAFGPAPSTDPAKAGPVIGDRSGKTQLTNDQLRGVAPGTSINRVGRVTVTDPEQMRRKAGRKQAVADFDAKRRGAAASAIDAADAGGDINDVLRGLPASAQRGARRAFMGAQRERREVEALERLEQANQQQQPLPNLEALERAELIQLLGMGVLSEDQKKDILRRILGGGSIDDPSSGSTYNSLQTARTAYPRQNRHVPGTGFR